jgi:hypothetical protein
VAACSAGSDTTITGVVYDPAGKNPLPNILVYVPQATVSAFTDGVNPSTPVKDSYATLVTGNPLVSVTTGADGSFSLSGVPAGTDVPLVIQAGRWRRQFVISSVAACTTTALYSTAVTTVGTDPGDLSTSNVTQGGSSSLSEYGEYTMLRFARNQNEGDIPRIAFVTGSADALECTVRKVGIDDSEFTDPNVGINSTSGSTAVSSNSPAGRVGLFQRNSGGGAKAPGYSGSGTAVSSVQTGYALFGSTNLLNGYNVLMLPCAGTADSSLETNGANIADAQNVASFTNAGGRVFSTHFSSDLLNSVSSISGAANWISPVTPSNTSTGTAIVNQSSTDSDTMGQWLYGLNGGTKFSVAVSQLRISQTGTNSPTVNWATLSSALLNGSSTVSSPVVEFSYYTPFSASSTADQYGRVFFTDYHVNNSSSSNAVFPAECTSTMAKTSAMSTQEQMLEYSLFQLMNFAIPQFVPELSVTAAASPATLTTGETGDGLALTITNNSSTQPITLDAPVTMVLTLPGGITATAVNATGWTCTTSSSSVSCTLGSELAPGASNTVDVTVDIGSSVSSGSSTITALLNSEEFTSNPTYSLSVNTTSAVSTSTVLSASPTSLDYGGAVNLTGTVTAASGTASGTVTFYDGGVVLGTWALSSGAASLASSMLVPGTHSLTAVYNGNSPYTTSTSTPVAVIVASAATTTTLTPAAATVTAGSPVSVTVVVASAYGTPAGTVTFYDGATLLGTGTLNSNGQAGYTASSLPVGTHNLTAVYSEGSSWGTSTSAPVAVTVTSANTTTAVSPSASSAIYGSPVTFAASVSSAAGTPSGTVTFYDGAALLGTGTLSNGATGLTTSALIVGAHSITAVYGGVSSYATSTSAPVAVNVTKASTATTLSASAGSVMIGSPVTFTAQVSSAAGSPTGTVTFFDGATALGTTALSGGTTALTTSELAAVTHSVTAIYNGTGTYAASTSPALAEAVIDLSMTVSGTGGGAGGAGGTSSTATTVAVQTGASASVLVQLSSSQNIAMPVNSTLTVTGQPAGTTITLAGKDWQATSGSSWLYPKGYALTNPTLTFKLPSQLTAKSEKGTVFPDGAKSILLSLLLLPFVRRRRRTAKRLMLLAVLALSMAGALGMTGCAAHNGFYAEQSYPVTITLTAGAVSKVSYVTLNVN